jgi:tRNA (guanine37-N1)-methyltransferase
VLGNAESLEQDSFAKGLLDHPHYTRPDVFEGVPVPEVLRSGDHAAVARWRLRESMARTKRVRPDLWEVYLKDRAKDLPRPDQWSAWQVEHPEDRDREKPKGWKGFG